jgi:hypothetical protein
MRSRSLQLRDRAHVPNPRISVLDRADDSAFSLGQMALLEYSPTRHDRRAHRAAHTRSAARDGSADVAVVPRWAKALDRLEGWRREAGLRMLEEQAALLSAP